MGPTCFLQPQRLLLEDANELRADDFALLLRVDSHLASRARKRWLRIDNDKRDIKVTAERLHDLFSLRPRAYSRYRRRRR